MHRAFNGNGEQIRPGMQVEAFPLDGAPRRVGRVLVAAEEVVVLFTTDHPGEDGVVACAAKSAQLHPVPPIDVRPVGEAMLGQIVL